MQHLEDADVHERGLALGAYAQSMGPALLTVGYSCQE